MNARFEIVIFCSIYEYILIKYLFGEVLEFLYQITKNTINVSIQDFRMCLCLTFSYRYCN